MSANAGNACVYDLSADILSLSRLSLVLKFLPKSAGTSYNAHGTCDANKFYSNIHGTMFKNFFLAYETVAFRFVYCHK